MAAILKYFVIFLLIIDFLSPNKPEARPMQTQYHKQLLLKDPIELHRKAAQTSRLTRQIVQPIWLTGLESLFKTSKKVQVTEQNLSETAALRSEIATAVENDDFFINLTEEKQRSMHANNSAPVAKEDAKKSGMSSKTPEKQTEKGLRQNDPLAFFKQLEKSSRAFWKQIARSFAGI